MDPKTGAFRHDNMAVPDTSRVLPLFSLKGRTAIVSGAGAGIGLAIAQGLAEAGANVAIWYNSNKQALKEAEKIEKDYGVKCKPAYPFSIASLLMKCQAEHTKSMLSHPKQSTRPSTTLSLTSMAV